MVSDPQDKISAMADKICVALAAAQFTLWTLEAIHNESKKQPEVDSKRPLMMEQIWRGLFDRLYIKIGSVIESSAGAANLSNLRLLGLKELHGDKESCEEIDKAYKELKAFEGIRKWRNKVVAHSDAKFDATSFHAMHKMHVSQYQSVIDRLFDVLNTISFLTTSKVYVRPTFFDLYAREAEQLYRK